MKLISCTEKQQDLLQMLHPEHDRPTHMALVPTGEYYFWARRFLNMLDSLSGHFNFLNLSTITQLPIIQCVSKFVGVNKEGYLYPRTFKFNSLVDGNLRDFGVSSQMKPLMGSLSSFMKPYTPMTMLEKPKPALDKILGFLAWDENHPPRRGAKNLPHFIKCASNIDDVILDEHGRLYFEGKEYDHFLPTYRYYPNTKFQKKMMMIREAKKLLIPASSPLSNLKKLTTFRNPTWAEVKPLEFFLDEAPESLEEYVLIRVDDGKIITWDEVMKDPKLRLEIEMSEYWLWQEACHTSESLQHINMYWEFGTDYPWLLDKRTGNTIPVYVVGD
jgi:hypothetical protein